MTERSEIFTLEMDMYQLIPMLEIFKSVEVLADKYGYPYYSIIGFKTIQNECELQV